MSAQTENEIVKRDLVLMSQNLNLLKNKNEDLLLVNSSAINKVQELEEKNETLRKTLLLRDNTITKQNNEMAYLSD